MQKERKINTLVSSNIGGVKKLNDGKYHRPSTLIVLKKDAYDRFDIIVLLERL